MEELLSKKKLRLKFIRNGLKTVKKKFSAEIQFRKLINFLKIFYMSKFLESYLRKCFRTIKKYKLIKPKDRIFVALSRGKDSAANLLNGENR